MQPTVARMSLSHAATLPGSKQDWVTRAFSVLAESARSASWPPTGSYAIGGREGKRAGADSKQTENATRRFA